MTGATLNSVPGKTSLRVTFEQRLKISMFLVTRSSFFFKFSHSQGTLTLSSMSPFCSIHVLVAQGCVITLTALYRGRQKSLICSPAIRT